MSLTHKETTLAGAKMMTAAACALLWATAPWAMGQEPAPSGSNTPAAPNTSARPTGAPPAGQDSENSVDRAVGAAVTPGRGAGGDRDALLVDLRAAAANTVSLSIGLMAAATALIGWFSTMLIFMLQRRKWRWRTTEMRLIDVLRIARSIKIGGIRGHDAAIVVRTRRPRQVCVWVFYPLAGCAILCLIVSIIWGGKGLQALNQGVINQAGVTSQVPRPAGGDGVTPARVGAWDFRGSGEWFNLQAMAGALAVLLILFSIGIYTAGTTRVSRSTEAARSAGSVAPLTPMVAVSLSAIQADLTAILRSKGIPKPVETRLRSLSQGLAAIINASPSSVAGVPPRARSFGKPGANVARVYGNK